MNIGLVIGILLFLMLGPAVFTQLLADGHPVGAAFALAACLLPIPIGYILAFK